MQHHFNYRADIDGLRAIAVTAVLAFHAFPDALPGGFVGVDIFFVISGYLISRIILGDLKADTFSFATFYNRRIRRIFPALIVVMIFTIAIGWWGLLPADYRQLGTHIVGGALFVSNFVLWGESGYFDTAATSKPLLHLWSLGVEEQYYLVWPLVLFLFRKHVHRMFWIILLVAIGSFALNIYATPRHPDAAFYWPMPRFWELMIGSMIAYAQTFPPTTTRSKLSPLQRTCLSFAGALLLASAFALINEDRRFPGWWALLPTCGTALIICAGPDAWPNRCLLSARLPVFVGLISYPLYLWHWPLLTFPRIFRAGNPPSAEVRLALLGISFLAAWATYQFFELRIRRASRTLRPHWVVGTLAAGMAVLGVYGVLQALTAQSARSASVPYLAQVSEAFDDWHEIDDAVLQGDSPRTVLFIGDSHMGQYLPRVVQVAHDRHPVKTVAITTSHGCAPVPGIDRPGHDCSNFASKGFKMAHEENVDTVVIGASWTGFIGRTDYYRAGEQYSSGSPLNLFTKETKWVLDGLENQIKSLRDEGKQVVLILCSPRGDEFDPRKMVVKDGFEFHLRISKAVPRSLIVARNADMDNWLRTVAARTGAIVVDPLDALCTATTCPTVDRNGAPLLMDESHLRASTVVEKFTLLDPFIYLQS